jgi:cytoskeletal protein RodZ
MQDRTWIYVAAIVAVVGAAWWIFLILRDVVQGRGHLRDWPWKKRRRNH